jgi:tyrosine aminotransferase/nicotianamine aminotransferase
MSDDNLFIFKSLLIIFLLNLFAFGNSALAKHLSSDLPYELSSDDIFLTAGGTQAIEVVISVLAHPGTNILLPRPGYPNYEARAALNNLEVRHFDLIPERGWEIDIDSLESVADKNTTAMVIINPNNPCGSVYTHEHLAKVWLFYPIWTSKCVCLI